MHLRTIHLCIISAISHLSLYFFYFHIPTIFEFSDLLADFPYDKHVLTPLDYLSVTVAKLFFYDYNLNHIPS